MADVKMSDFLIWWRDLNAAMHKIKPGQQVLFGDARDYYRAWHTPETAAQAIWDYWAGIEAPPYGRWEH